jgi:ADP-ribosylglycohydrolase
MVIRDDYIERVYAGVLGKLIGVYLGRPFEGWTYDRIMGTLGEVHYYVHDRLNKPLIVTDDDISGTFTFFRALADYSNRRDITAKQIGQTWLNYIIEGRTILWWGGMGNSTEHTAFLRLKAGVPAPESGSTALNSKVVAEQIGAQIFIDAWAMACPGDPELAVELAGKAASVSHDGEAVHGAQVIAAMEAQAFVESDLNKLLDAAVSFIPKDAIIYRMIGDIRDWRQQDGDWRKTRERIAAHYGYDKYGGNCHMVPNHALIMLGLLYGEDDFQRSLMITNTAGWDTDCNSGNVGCLMGIKNGLAGIDAGPDWRGPVADRLYLSTADGGRGVTDAVRETYEISKTVHTLANKPFTPPKGGARFHFELPGALQGFQVENSPESQGTATLENVEGHSATGSRSLAIRYKGLVTGRSARVATATFIPPEAIQMPGYTLIASPTLYPGQTISARLSADGVNQTPVRCSLYIQTYGEADRLAIRRGETHQLSPGAEQTFNWKVDATEGAPIAAVGVEISSETRADGVVYLDYLTWEGTPTLAFKKPPAGGTMWQRAWVNAADNAYFIGRDAPTYRIIQNHGTGMLIQGVREWKDYVFSASVSPHLATSAGVAVCVQGLKRYYALLLCNDRKLRLIKELDGYTVLAEKDFAWEWDGDYHMQLQTQGKTLTLNVNGANVFAYIDENRPLLSGGAALVVAEGRVDFGNVMLHEHPREN